MSTAAEELAPERGRPSVLRAIRPAAGQLSSWPAAALSRARREYALCARRAAALGDLCFDPAWNMLLYLLLEEAAGVRLGVTDLCLGSRAPTATAIRYIGHMVEQGLMARSPDDHDARRSFVHLTDRGRALLRSLLCD